MLVFLLCRKSLRSLFFQVFFQATCESAKKAPRTQCIVGVGTYTHNTRHRMRRVIEIQNVQLRESTNHTRPSYVQMHLSGDKFSAGNVHRVNLECPSVHQSNLEQSSSKLHFTNP